MCATCSGPSSGPVSSCTDLPWDSTVGGGATWTASNGKTCQNYEDNKWCTSEGGYGTGWPSGDVSFSSFARGGVDATQACCACGGGTTPFSSLQTYSDTNDYAECLVSSTCPVGMGVTAQTNDADTVCTACGAGFFSSKDDHGACAPHSTCDIGYGVFAQGTTSADTQCEQCVAGTSSQPIGTFSAVVGLGACTGHSICDPGFGTQNVPIQNADTICAECTGSSYSFLGVYSVVVPRMCVLHTTCPIGEGVVSSGTAFANTICEVCGSGKYVRRD